ncbi:MAG: Cytosol aminopeptidase [Candidatus Parcubacteria bacterium]
MNIHIKPAPTDVPKVIFSGTKSRFDDNKIVLPQSKKSLTHRRSYARVRSIVRMMKTNGYLEASVSWNDLAPQVNTIDKDVFAEHILTHAFAASYDFTRYKSKKDEVPKTLYITDAPPILVKKLEDAQVIAESLSITRNFANASAGDMTPASFAQDVKQLFKPIAKVSVDIFDETKLEKMGAGALIGVGKGSTHKPRLIVISYKGGSPKERPIALVGKGITFDSGGLQVKPASGGSMHEMHLDMSGGASVVGAIFAAAKLRVKKNIVAVIPAAENMISSMSYRPGDVLTSLSGKTIEVLNTDAEGRLVLADALTYVQRTYKPRLIIDVATLTGAALVALGDVAHAIFSNDESVLPNLQRIGEETGEYVWPLPLWEEYEYMLKSDRADIGNIATEAPRYGGTINGAIFLKEFIEDDTLWVHMDMAPRMTASSRDHLGKGATGEPLRFLLRASQVISK